MELWHSCCYLMFVCYARVADNYKEIPDLLRTRIRTTSDGGMGSEQIDDLLKVFAIGTKALVL